MLCALLWGMNIPKGCPITAFQILLFKPERYPINSLTTGGRGRKRTQLPPRQMGGSVKEKGKVWLKLISRLGHTENTGPVSASFTPSFHRTSHFLACISAIPLTAPLFPDACNRCLAQHDRLPWPTSLSCVHLFLILWPDWFFFSHCSFSM